MATMRKTATSQSATNKTSTNKRAANSNNDIAAVLTLSSNRNTSFFKTVTQKSSKSTQVDYKPKGKTKKIQKMLTNLEKDKSLDVSKEQKTAMVIAAENLLNSGYDSRYVAGVLANIQCEGSFGKFESSNYESNPQKEPPYIKYMDKHFNYEEKYSGRNIQDIGIKETYKLAKKAEKSGYKGMYGLGLVQWTKDRTLGVLEYYEKYSKSDKPTLDECIDAEMNFMADELKKEYAYVYSAWKSGDKTARNAGKLVCIEYERPSDKVNRAKKRGDDARKIYKIMKKK